MASKTSLSPSFAKAASKCKFSSPQNPTTSNVSHQKSSVDKFLQGCRSGKFTVDQARQCFDLMICMEPTPSIRRFNTFLSALFKQKHYGDVLLMYKRLDSMGFPRDPFSLNNLTKCFCNMGRVSDGFAVLATILKVGFRPNNVTFTFLIEGLCAEGRVSEASFLFEKIHTFGCKPDLITYGSFVTGLCPSGHAIEALKLHQDMVNGDAKCGVTLTPNLVSYTALIDGLCKQG